jgi:hypothetical protein
MLAQGCSVAQSGSTALAGSSPCTSPKCQTGAQSKDDYAIVLAMAGAGAAGTTAVLEGASLPTLCQVQKPSCDPDDATSCSNAAPVTGQGGAPGSLGSTDSASGSQARPSSAGGADSAGTGGTSEHASTSGQSNAGGYNAGQTPGGTAGAIAMACRVQRDLLVTLTTCEPAGQGTLGAPCVGRSNCAAGFACVEENGTAQCRPYCCRGVSSCSAGTYCDLRPTKELVATAERPTVSVCMPGVDCRFDDPYPCPPDRTCSCPLGKACGVVRADGTTACVTPGTGTEGQSCPCAAGHVCSDALGSCLKVCSLASRDPTCGDGICQASASLPADWGICVSSAALL